MIDDAQLLHTYVSTADEAAFATLVERHKGLVYGSALRQTNNAALAEEITQAVFIVLARKASTLKPRTILSGWLFRATRFIACDALKAEQRRVQREQASFVMNSPVHDSTAGANENVWQEISPVLDEALTRLGEQDRNALLLRFFEQKNLAEVGQALGIGEDGARKRVERALDKLRGLLGQRGVVIPAAVLSTALIANAVPSVPATLCVGAALTSTAATAPLVKGALCFMALSKTKIAVATVVMLLVLNTGVIVTLLAIKSHRARPRQDPLVSSTDANGFLSLFNANDLTGWKYNSDAWSVVDGTILGRVAPELGDQSHYLIWTNGLVDDFELHLKFRTTATGNSGVSLRALEIKNGKLAGYQAEIEGPRTGLFFIRGPGTERTLSHTRWRTVAREENGQDILEQFEPPFSSPAQIGEARRAVQSGEWCDYTVIAQGPHFVIVLNGITMTDTRDEHPTKFVSSGLMGLEYTHNIGREDWVEVKDIRFKRLTPVQAP